MQIQIRQATHGDEEVLARLLGVLGYPTDAAAIPQRIESCQGTHGRVWVAMDEGRGVGFLSFQAIPLFHEPGMLGRITAMAVAPSHHRQGVGRALVAEAEAFAAWLGCASMEVTSSDRRAADAHVFYRTLGYAHDCRRFLKKLAPEG